MNPKQCTITIALVSSVIACLMFSVVIDRLSSDISTKTGFIPSCTIDETSDTQPSGGTITSPMPSNSFTIAIEI